MATNDDTIEAEIPENEAAEDLEGRNGRDNGDDSSKEGYTNAEETNENDDAVKKSEDDAEDKNDDREDASDKGNGAEEEEDDSESDSNGSSSSGSDSDSDNDDEDGENGMSAYERLRLENVRRNNERLKQLGLASKDGGGVLGKKKSQQRRRKSATSETALAAPSRRSRRSAGTSVSYVEPSLREVMKSDQTQKVAYKPVGSEDAEAQAQAAVPQPARRGRPPKDDRSQRMARFVYDEFQRIRQHKKLMIKEAEKNKKSAETETKFWQKKAAAKEKRVQKAMEAERILKQQEEELATYGTTLRSFVQMLDRRTGEINAKIRLHDTSIVTAEQRVEMEARRLENENRLKLLDALDSFPKAMKEAARSLSAMLLDRAPKDPPPPRRSKRKSEDESAESEGPKKKSKKDEEKGPAEVESFADSAAISAAATQASLSQTETVLSSKDAEEDAPAKGAEEGKTRKKRELTVGGWVSPTFSPSVDRAWLEKDSAHSQFQTNSYVPQPGDTVLYYLAGHRDFLSKFPDHLAKNKISRCPLWERARKERNKAAKKKGQDETEEKEPIENPASSAPKSTWWTDEWLSESGIGGNLAYYPLICKVEKTQAEFPPDPTPKVNGTWVAESNPKVKGKKKAVIRLAISLRPLTSLTPPTWTETGPVEKQSLSPPPPFTAVTFPSALPPFIVPFAWAYVHNHSLALNDEVVIFQAKAPEKGKIRSFETLPSAEEDYGSFRLDDKMTAIADILGPSKGEASRKQEAGGDAQGKGKVGPIQTVPPQDAFVVCEFLSRLLSMNGVTIKKQSSSDEKRVAGLVNLIRSSLPLWKGVSVIKNLYDRKTFQASVWDMKERKARSKNDALTSQKEFVQFGLSTRTLDTVLGQKIECIIEDFLRETPAAAPFGPLVTDEIAQYYSCAVPISMSFARILQRLKQRKGANGVSTGWYRSFEAVLQDVNAIQDNCSLYNAPDSEIVASANVVIPAAKKALSSLFSSHVREHKEKLKQEDEKRKFLAAVVSSDPSLSQTSETKAQSKSADPFQEPFKGPLYRDWLQSMVPDAASIQWVPQTGDSILYSREMHKKFVEGHYDSLATNQCLIPQLLKQGASDKAEEDSKGETKGGASDEKPPPNSSEEPKEESAKPTATDNAAARAQQEPSEPNTNTNNSSPELAPAQEQTAESHANINGAEEEGKSAMPPSHPYSKEQNDPMDTAKEKEEEVDMDTTMKREEEVDTETPPAPATNTTEEPKEPTAQPTTTDNATAQKSAPSEEQPEEPNANNNDSENDSDGAEESPAVPEWVIGRVVGIRAEFPRARKARSSNEEGAFATDSPILAVAVQFPNIDPSQTSVVYWRPCVFACDVQSDLELSTGCCKTCAVRLATSFLCPSWANQFGGTFPEDISVPTDDQGKLPEPPLGIPKEEAIAIELNLSLLKWRCINQVPADQFDQNLTAERVKHGYLPQMNKVSPKSLPSFEDLLTDPEPSNKTMSTRGVKPNEPDPSLPELAAVNFLPPWLPQTVGTKKAKNDMAALQDSISPWPKLCLELILVRLKNNYYRSKIQIRADLMEAFVNSVVLCLAPEAKRKKSPLSIKKLAGVLNSRKYIPLSTSGAGKKSMETTENSKTAKAPKSKAPKSKAAKVPKAPKSPNRTSRKDSKVPKSPRAKDSARKTAASPKKAKKQKQKTGAKSVSGDAASKDGKGPKKQPSLKLRKTALNEEENLAVGRLERVRRLYAASLVAISEVGVCQYLNATIPMQISRPILRQKMIVFSQEDDRAMRARNVLTVLVAALGREMNMNRYPMTPTESPTMKVKITAKGEAIKGEQLVPVLDSSKPNAPSNPAVVATNTTTTADNPSAEATPAVKVQSNETSTKSAAALTKSATPANGAAPAPEIKFKTVVSDRVKFSLKDFEAKESVIRTFFGRPGRMFPCIRCQASKKSMLHCRVVKGHSNIDFDLGQFKGMGGLDGLLRALLKQPELPKPAAIEQSATVSKEPAEQKKADEGAEPTKVAGSNKKADEGATEPMDTERSEECKDKGGEQQKSPAYDTAGAEASGDGNQPAAESDSKPAAMVSANTNGRDNTKEEKEIDPRDLFKRAKSALALANGLHVSAKKYAEAPARLGEEFIAENFPVDTEDGKYLFCYICGLSGDLLICDTEGCPNVLHTSCANLVEIPEGDWYCDKCTAKKGCEAAPVDVEEKAEEKDNAVPMEAESLDDCEKAKADESGGAQDSSAGASDVSKDPDPSEVAKADETDKPKADETEETQGSAPTAYPEDEAQGEGKDDDAQSSKQGECSHRETKPLRTKICPSVGTILQPIVTYDEEMHSELTEELQELFVVRTGRRRKARSEEAAEEPSGKDNEDSKDEPESEAEEKPELGATFEKKFGRYGYFAGEVTSMPAEDQPFYRVTYEDGDKEDLSGKELMRLISQTRARKAEQAQPKKKRGRPRKSEVNAEQQTPKEDQSASAKKLKAASNKKDEDSEDGKQDQQDVKKKTKEKQPKRKREKKDDGDEKTKAEKKAKSAASSSGKNNKSKMTKSEDSKEKADGKKPPEGVKDGEAKDAEIEPAEKGEKPAATLEGKEAAAMEEAPRNNPRGRRSRRTPDRFVTSKHSA